MASFSEKKGALSFPWAPPAAALRSFAESFSAAAAAAFLAVCVTVLISSHLFSFLHCAFLHSEFACVVLHCVKAKALALAPSRSLAR